GFAVLKPFSTLAEEDKKTATTVEPLIYEEGMDQLTQPLEKKVAGRTLLCGVILSAKEFKAFRDTAGLQRYKMPQDIDWKGHAVVYVILRNHTNRLLYKQWNPPKNGAAEFVFHWRTIEPGYFGQCPAVLHRVERKDLKKVVFKYSSHVRTPDKG